MVANVDSEYISNSIQFANYHKWFQWSSANDTWGISSKQFVDISNNKLIRRQSATNWQSGGIHSSIHTYMYVCMHVYLYINNSAYIFVLQWCSDTHLIYQNVLLSKYHCWHFGVVVENQICKINFLIFKNYIIYFFPSTTFFYFSDLILNFNFRKFCFTKRHDKFITVSKAWLSRRFFFIYSWNMLQQRIISYVYSSNGYL